MIFIIIGSQRRIFLEIILCTYTLLKIKEQPIMALL